MAAAGDQASEVCHIHHQFGPDIVGDLSKSSKIDDAGIGRTTRHDQFRLMLAGEALDLIHVNPGILQTHTILYRVEPFARLVGRCAMGQMPTRCQ